MSVANTKFVKQVRFIVAPGGPNQKNVFFEGRNITVGFEEKFNEFELVDGTLLRKLEYYRFFLTLESPYLRRGDGTNASQEDFAFVLRQLDLDVPVRVNIPEYTATAYLVVKGNDGISVSTDRQRVTPSINYTFRGVSKITALPEWFNFTRPTPGYLNV